MKRRERRDPWGVVLGGLVLTTFPFPSLRPSPRESEREATATEGSRLRLQAQDRVEGQGSADASPHRDRRARLKWATSARDVGRWLAPLDSR